MMFKKQSGFSLLEVMVAAAILGGLALAGAKLMENQTKSMKTIEVRGEYNAVLAEIRSILAIETSCIETFNNLPAVNTDPNPTVPGVVSWIKQKPAFTAAVNRFQAATDPSDWRTGPAYGNGNVRILSFKFSDVSLNATPAPDGSRIGSLNLVLRMQAGVNKTVGAEVLERKIPMSIEVINAANNIRKCSSSGTVGLDNRYLIRSEGGDIFGPVRMVNEGILDPSNFIMTSGTNIVLNNGANMFAQTGSNIYSQTGSTITAQNGSSIILNSGANMTAQNGSNIVLNAGAGIVAQNGSAITAQGGANFVLNSAANLIAQAGSTVTAQNGSNMVLNAGAALVAQSGSNIVLNGGAAIVAQNNSSIVMQDSSFIDFTSDRTFKYDIKDLKNISEKMRKVRPVSYRWKKSGKEAYGVIAQELMKVFPKLVRQNGANGTYTVDYIQMIPLLLEGVKEVDKENLELKKSLTKLREEQKKQNEELRMLKEHMCKSNKTLSFCQSKR